MARMTLALLVLGTLLVDARLTKPRGLDDKELTALAQLSDKADDTLQDETQDKEEDEPAHEPGHEPAHEPEHADEKSASKEAKKEAKSETKKEADPHHQGKVKVIPEPEKPEPESTRVDVKVHSPDPLPEDEKVDVTVIVNDTKVKGRQGLVFGSIDPRIPGIYCSGRPWLMCFE
ncbi:unnamed protein product [Cladocopium goreaui]|uniref:Uncharacterized protein n=1 Tax=Cladocopium goreaui TaxID=2562237 RepID=A0A9P1GFC3_9DINO|nr:unnamed protein product [Cladocopium goreaui]